MKKKIQPNLEFLNFRIVQIIQMKTMTIDFLTQKGND